MLLYGQHLGLNHLVSLNSTFNVVKLDKMIDCPTVDSGSLDNKLHLHSFHFRGIFSKLDYIDGKYDNITELSNENYNQINYYCLKIALEAKRTNSTLLNEMFRLGIDSKN